MNEMAETLIKKFPEIIKSDELYDLYSKLIMRVADLYPDQKDVLANNKKLIFSVFSHSFFDGMVIGFETKQLASTIEQKLNENEVH